MNRRFQIRGFYFNAHFVTISTHKGIQLNFLKGIESPLKYNTLNGKL